MLQPNNVLHFGSMFSKGLPRTILKQNQGHLGKNKTSLSQHQNWEVKFERELLSIQKLVKVKQCWCQRGTVVIPGRAEGNLAVALRLQP